MMGPIDLHVHSCCSDGSLTPGELVELAAAKGLSAFALTDHDTVEGLTEAFEAARRHGEALTPDACVSPVRVIPGIELSTAWKGRDIHILGLLIDPHSPIFHRYLQDFVNSRRERNRKMCLSLASAGIDITYEKLTAEFPVRILTRSHFARYLYHHGYTGSYREAFDRYIGDHSPHYIPRERITPQKAIELIHQADGLAILAHPLHYRFSSRDLEALVEVLKEQGLDGLEAVYCTHSPSEEQYLRSLAARNELAVSGGSDFHGSVKPGLELGSGYGRLYIPASILEELEERMHRKGHSYEAPI
ncbi:MAG: PHP domain-containing protein [Lachnospiraceae bacterium]|nr:PHP domain-containing protein [Lachnospiraceae bacterium]